MRRIIASIVLVAALAPVVWLREPLPATDRSQTLRFTRLALPPAARRAPLLGAFRLEAAWQMNSRNSDFAGYSALLPLAGGDLLAISDRGRWLRFAPPGEAASRPRFGVVGSNTYLKSGRDAEAATIDPRSGMIWIAWERRNAISRHDAALRPRGRIAPRQMRDWPSNSGPEAMVRLADGRFLVLQEGFDGWFEDRRHQALAFAGDPLNAPPPLRFAFAGAPGYSPTDMAQLPDGRVLVLMRRLRWPLPLRFSGRIVIADPAAIRAGGLWQGREVARLEPPLPVDNFEGIAVTPGERGLLTVWLISDDNSAVTQRALLWKLSLDPARLPGARKKAREKPPRP